MRGLWSLLVVLWSLVWALVVAVALLAVALLIVGLTSGVLCAVLLCVDGLIGLTFVACVGRLLWSGPV
jgi:hypothetical protein